MDVRERVIAILAEQSGLDTSDITPDRSLDDLGIDSLAVVESIFAIEEEFDIAVPYNANQPEASAFDVSSVGSILRAVEDLVAQNAE